MDFKYDDEQDALREATRGLVGKAYSDYENRRQAVKDDPGFDEKQWAKMADRSRSASCARSSAGSSRPSRS